MSTPIPVMPPSDGGGGGPGGGTTPPSTGSGDWAAIADFPGGVTASKQVNFSGLNKAESLDLAGTYTVLSTTSTQIILSNPALVNPAWDNLTGDTDYASPSLSTSGDRWVGPYVTELPDLDRFISNFIAQQGIYKLSSDGKQQSFSVSVLVEITPVDSGDLAIGAAQTFTLTIVGSSNDKDFKANTMFATGLTNQRISIRARRTTPTDLNFNGSVVDTVQWRDAYGGAPVAQSNFGNITTAFTRTYGTNSATSLKQRELNALVTRKVATWNGTAFGSPIASTNAADIICAISLDPKIGNRTLAELNVQGIYDEVARLTDYFGTDLATSFSYTFDDDNVSFEETITTVSQAVFGLAYRLGSVINFFGETETDDSLFLFNHRNKIPGSEQRTITFGNANDYDGVEFEYVSPVDDTTQTLYRPEDQSARNPNKIQSVGIRSLEQATIAVDRAWNKIRYQNVTTQFECLEQAEYLIINNRVAIADNTRADTFDGHIVAQDGLILELSQPLTSGADGTYTIFLQMTDGTVEALAVTKGEDEWHVILAEPPSLPLVIDDGRVVKTFYQIIENGSPRGNAFLLSAKETANKNTFNITAINYDARYYANDKDFA